MTHTPGPWVNMGDGDFFGEIRSTETFELIAVMPEFDDRTDDFNLIAAVTDLLSDGKKLANEVRGTIALLKDGEHIGWTNLACLQQRLTDFDEAVFEAEGGAQ